MVATRFRLACRLTIALVLAWPASAWLQTAATPACALVLMHGKWGGPQGLAPFADKVEPACHVVLLEMPWSGRRSYDQPYPVALKEISAQVQTLRERQSLNSLGDPLPPKVCHRADRAITVTDGNHSVLLSGEPLAAKPVVTGLEILHFPVRSYQQLERKIRDGAEALARNTRVPAHVGITWRRLYRDHLLAGTLPAYYDSLRPDQETLASVLASGEVLEDRRLQRDFSQFSPTNTDSP